MYDKLKFLAIFNLIKYTIKLRNVKKKYQSLKKSILRNIYV